jgi:hypothetical protein
MALLVQSAQCAQTLANFEIKSVGCRSPKSLRLPEVGFKVQTEYARCVQRRQRNKEKG